MQKTLDEQRVKTGKIVGISICSALTLIAAALFYGNSQRYGSHNGSNTNLYSAIRYYSTATTQLEADEGVDDIADATNISHERAENVAINFTANHFPESSWAKTAKSEKMLGLLP